MVVCCLSFVEAVFFFFEEAEREEEDLAGAGELECLAEAFGFAEAERGVGFSSPPSIDDGNVASELISLGLRRVRKGGNVESLGRRVRGENWGGRDFRAPRREPPSRLPLYSHK